MSCETFPARPEIEFTRMNIAEIPAAVFVSDQFINSRIGVRKIPPPTPTRPESKPTIAPMTSAIQMYGWRDSASDFQFHARRIAATINTTPRTILYAVVGSVIVPPMYANGIDVTANGRNVRHEKNPAR